MEGRSVCACVRVMNVMWLDEMLVFAYVSVERNIDQWDSQGMTYRLLNVL